MRYAFFEGEEGRNAEAWGRFTTVHRRLQSGVA